MNIVSRQTVVVAYQRCLALDPSRDHQVACHATAISLGISVEAVEDALADIQIQAPAASSANPE